jgi:hypothetical protein
MAFRKDCLKAVGGFDPKFKIAGDDVDLCWRFQQYGLWIAFAPAAIVWHIRRNSISAYWKQQLGYGKAEALLEKKWPKKYNNIGHVPWNGRIYGKGTTKSVGWKKWRIYYGTGGCAPFQRIYSNSNSFLQSLTLIPEWYLVCFICILLSILSVFWKPLLVALPLFAVTVSIPFFNVVQSMKAASFTSKPLSKFDQLKLKLLTGFLHIIQPAARLFGRLNSGLTPWRWYGPPYYAFPRPRKYKIWSDNWRPADKWLQSIKAAIQKTGAMVKQGGDFDRWDLEVRLRLFGGVRSQMAVEEHGAGKQLLRIRNWPLISPTAIFLILMFALLFLLAADEQVWLIAIFFISVAAGLAIIIYQDCAAATGACLLALSNKKALINYDADVREINKFTMRKKVRKGNEFANFDRRQNNNSNYNGPERRSNIDRRENFAAVSSQKKEQHSRLLDLDN